MSQDLLPVLAQQNDMRIVEVDGQPVVTARDLARALEYKSEYGVLVIFKRNRESFRERGDQIEIPFGNSELKGDVKLTVPLQNGSRGGQSGIPLNYSELKYDTGEVEIDTPGGRQLVRYFTKRGALKVCMKSNQPKAVAVQEALIDLYEQVERGELVSAGYLQDVVRELKSEINRLSRLVAGAGDSLGVQPANVVQVVYISRRRKPYSFDDAALAFLQELFIQRPRAKVVELDRHLREEAAKKSWKVGSTDSVYRAVANWKKAASGLI